MRRPPSAKPNRSHSDERPLIAHVVHRFDIGGMENGVANLINSLPAEFARHCVIALTEVSPDFARRVRQPDVGYVSLHKPEGQTARVLPALWRALRRLRPAIVHTRNVATLECQIAACAARVPVRIHGEHGWDIGDLDGTNRRMLWLRRALRPLVHQQIALSNATEAYLRDRVGVPAPRLTNICNGVDTDKFAPADRAANPCRVVLPGQWPEDAFVIGAVGRVAAVKNLELLLHAVATAATTNPGFARRARLAIVGDGPELPALRQKAASLGLAAVAWFAGSREDIPVCMRAMDLVVVPSLAEGISNTILEAMASGVAVVATDVGGNRDLVVPGVTGELVESRDTAAVARAIVEYFTDSQRLAAHGQAARNRAVTEFSLQEMESRYHLLYREALLRSGHIPVRASDAEALTQNR